MFGTRPEAIKLAPLIHALRSAKLEFDLQVCVTGQHRQMLDQVLEIFSIEPDIDLKLMRPDQNLAELNASVLVSISEELEKWRPDIVIVHGDTTTTFATAMASYYAGIPIAHIEAGLRTFNLQSPFPEEFNRQIVTRLASLHFAPTELCRDNLLAEHVSDKSITVTGNTIIDSLNWTLATIENNSDLSKQLVSDLNQILLFPWEFQRFVLITGHRRENFGDGFMQICFAIRDLSERFPLIHFVYPVHLNPKVLLPVNSILGSTKNVHLVEPQNYLHFIYLLKHCHIVLTDSGGIQEEAPSFGKPVLLMRESTERPEALEAGTVKLVGANRKKIVECATALLEDTLLYNKMATAHNPFGDGEAVERIMNVLRTI